MIAIISKEEEVIHKFLTELGRKGGNATLKKHGKEHFKKLRAIPRKKLKA